jgi:TolB-like protein/Tfp pilus assembly protein PilF
MSIWSSEIKELEKLYESFKGQLPGLEKELAQLFQTEDANVIMLYSRRCLEVIITDLCECELKRPRKTEPLKGIIDKLHKEEKVPSHIITSMHGLNELSTYGAHPKDFDPEQVKPVLNNLDIIIKWYLKYKNIVTIDKTEVEDQKVQPREQPPKEIRGDERKEVQNKPAKVGEQRLISIIALASILIIAAILIYPKIFKQDSLEMLRSSGERISVVVIPFQNMTNDTTWNVWQDGIQNELITYLTNSEELKIRQPESINTQIQSKGLTNYASITPSIASKISQKLDANIFIYGSIKQAGTKVRISAQLIDTKTQDAFKSFQIDGIAENILHLIDSLSSEVKNFLIISELEKELPVGFRHYGSTKSLEAFRYVTYGNKSFFNRDYPTATDWYLKAMAVDTAFALAACYLSVSYFNQGLYEQGEKWCLEIYKKRDLLPLRTKIMTNWLYAFYFETIYEQIKYLKQFLEIDDLSPLQHYLLGASYNGVYQYDNAISEFEKSLDVSDKLGTKPLWVRSYTELGYAYHKTGQFKKEKELYKRAEEYFSDNNLLLYRQAVLAISEGKTKEADEYVRKYTAIRKEMSASEATIATSLGDIFRDAGILDKAEEYYRQAFLLEPGNPTRMNNLAWFLIDEDRNVNEGLKLIDEALRLSPEIDYMLDTKGWGLYKQGKYKEALEFLEKSWDVKSTYDHEIYLHLEAAKKAVAGQKNN